MDVVIEVFRALLPIVGLAVGAIVVLFAVVFSRSVFQFPENRWARDDEIPPHLPEHLRPALDELATLGFVAPRYVLVRPALRALGATRIKALVGHPMENAWAFVGTSDVAEVTNPFTFTFRTRFEGRPTILTANLSRSGLLVEPPGVELVDPRAPTTAGLWQAHRAAVRAAGVAPLEVDGDGCLAREQAEDVASLHALVGAGLLRPIDEGTWRFSARGLARSLRLAPGTLVDMSAMRRARRKARGNAESGGPRLPEIVPAEEEAQAYIRARAMLEGEKKRRRWGWILLATGIAFALSLKGTLPATSLCALIGVVALHEGGHYLAMRVFRYRDTSVFFIPFLGAATMGRKEDATAFQEFVVLLAGPLPGLLLATALLPSGPELLARPELSTAVEMLLFINLLNLLPVMPLDGGRIVHLLLFARHPVADLLFTLVGAALLAAAAFAANEPVLAGLGAAFVLGSLQNHRAARIAAELRHAPPEVLADDAARLAFTFRALHRLGYGKLSTSRRQSLVRLVTQLRRPAPPGCLGALTGLTVYAACLVGVPIAAAMMWFSGLAGQIEPPKAAAPSPFMAGSMEGGTSVECREARGPVRSGPLAATRSPATWVIPAGSAEEAGRWVRDPARAAALRGEASVGQPVERVAAWDRLVFVAGGRALDPKSESESDTEGGVPRRTARISLAPPSGWVDARESRQRVEVALRCHGADGEAARRIASEVDERLAELPGMHLRAPWAPGPTLTAEEAEAQARAWSSYRALRAAEPAPEPATPMAPWRMWWQMVSEPTDPAASKRAAEARRAERHAKQRARVEQTIVTARARDPLDEEIVALYREAAAPATGADRWAAAQRLGARLGQSRVEQGETGYWSAVPAEAVHEMWADPRAEGAELWFTSASFLAIDTGLPEVVDYLCARSCTSVDYWLRQSERDDDEDDE